jgi:hypothetical protein
MLLNRRYNRFALFALLFFPAAVLLQLLGLFLLLRLPDLPFQVQDFFIQGIDDNDKRQFAQRFVEMSVCKELLRPIQVLRDLLLLCQASGFFFFTPFLLLLLLHAGNLSFEEILPLALLFLLLPDAFLFVFLSRLFLGFSDVSFGGVDFVVGGVEQIGARYLIQRAVEISFRFIILSPGKESGNLGLNRLSAQFFVLSALLFLLLAQLCFLFPFCRDVGGPLRLDNSEVRDMLQRSRHSLRDRRLRDRFRLFFFL